MEFHVKIVSLLAMGLIPFQAHALWDTGWLDNWLVGVSTGYITREADIVSSITTVSDYGSFSRNSSDNGWLGAVFGGYQSIYRQWLIGGEFNLEWENVNSSHDYMFAGDEVSTRYRRKGVIDFSGRAGYALTSNLMPYLRLGVEVSRDSLASSFEGITPDAFIYNKAWIHRFLVGIGAEMPIPDTCGLTVRLEYDYHSKGKTIEDFGATGIGLQTIEYYTAMQPRSYSGRVSLVWNLYEH